jgi:hypothetical protein
MKVTITFDSYEEAEELENALNGGKYRSQLEEIWNNVFRPYHKHGFNNERINELLASNDDDTPMHPEVHELFDYLEARYRETVYDE